LEGWKVEPEKRTKREREGCEIAQKRVREGKEEKERVKKLKECKEQRREAI
jgi:hypothetical protein